MSRATDDPSKEAAPSQGPPTGGGPKPYRLPTNVRPTHYHVSLDARLGRETFDGRVTIELELADETDTLELHARELDIQTAKLVAPGADDEALTVELERLDEAEAVRLSLPRRVPAGSAQLVMTYTGTVSRSMEGLYLSKDGDEACLATQCEATDARAIFPCFDEPAFKARVSWEVTTDPDVMVLANGPLADKRGVDTENGPGTRWRFEATPPISSYLAATAIGAFASTTAEEARGVPFRVWALAGKEGLGAYANEFSTRLLPWYEDYFDHRYAFTKYDQVAVPSFSFGAMENVGLVVFRSSLLLMDPATVSWRQQRHIALVVAHEFAHMWFGNLVTMAWWDDLWLNEAFAEWIAHKAVDELDPGLDVWREFQARAMSAFWTDALASTHPIYNPVGTPEEAMEMFDQITYQKGSAVMRMLEGFLGADAFRQGLRTYMAAFAEDNAKGDDLWRHLGKASGRPVEPIMASWIGQGGHPIVSVTWDREGSPEGKVAVQLAQRRYRSSAKAGASDETWPVPMVLRWADGTGVHETRHLLDAREDQVELPVHAPMEWLHANADDTGFYRVAPDDDLLEGLVQNWTALKPAEKAGVLRDQWGLVRDGTRPIGAFLELMDRVAAGDDHYAVVDQYVSHLGILEAMLETAGDEGALASLRAWVAERFVAELATLGYEPPTDQDEEPSTAERRATVLRAVAGIGADDRALERVRRLAETERGDPEAVHPSLAGTVVNLAARYGDADLLDANVRTYEQRREAHAPPQEVDRYLHSLAAFRDAALVERVLARLLDGLVPNQSVGPLLTQMLAETRAQGPSWSWIKEHFEELHATVGDSWVIRIVEASGNLPPELKDDVVSFWTANLDGLASEAFGRAQERMDERAELYERTLDELVAWAGGLDAAPGRGT